MKGEEKVITSENHAALRGTGCIMFTSQCYKVRFQHRSQHQEKVRMIKGGDYLGKKKGRLEPQIGSK